MKKGDLFEGIVDVIEFPNKGIVTVDGERIVVKNALPGDVYKRQVFTIH